MPIIVDIQPLYFPALFDLFHMHYPVIIQTCPLAHRVKLADFHIPTPKLSSKELFLAIYNPVDSNFHNYAASKSNDILHVIWAAS